MPVSIEINNIGPIEEFSERLEPGITVLRGPQGCGKTTILRTVELGTTGDTSGKLTKKDGSKVGTADIAGRLLKINRVTRTEGELSVDTLGDIDLSAIHSPKFEKAETRDANRIKLLVRMAAVGADLAVFQEELTQKSAITVEEFTAITSETEFTTDIVDVAATLKRIVDKTALAKERSSETLAAQAKAKLDQIKDLDLSTIPDLPTLLKTWTDASHNEIAVNTRVEDAKKAEKLAEESRNKLSALQKTQETSSDAAVVHQMVCHAELTDANHELARAKLAMDAATEAVRFANDRCTFADESLKRAMAHAASLESLNDAINAAVPGPTPEEVAAAKFSKETAQRALFTGEMIKDGLLIEAAAREINKQAKDLAKSAERHRTAAGLTFNCVTAALGKLENCPLSVMDIDGSPRLVIATDRSPEEPFDELSDGERWKVLVPLATGPNRLVTLSQAGWGELQPSNRWFLHNLIHSHDGFLLTAQADDKPLRAELYKEGQ